MNTIKEAIIKAEKYYQSKPGEAADVPATAVVGNGLQCQIQSPDGKFVTTDMFTAIGGTATANSPGWLCRAAIASCDATLLAMRAARKGVVLDKIEVKVEAKSDGAGMFLEEGLFPGSTEIRTLFNIQSKQATAEQIKELVDWVVAHAPVASDITRAVEIQVELKTSE